MVHLCQDIKNIIFSFFRENNLDGFPEIDNDNKFRLNLNNKELRKRGIKDKKNRERFYELLKINNQLSHYRYRIPSDGNSLLQSKIFYKIGVQKNAEFWFKDTSLIEWTDIQDEIRKEWFDKNMEDYFYKDLDE